MYDYSDVEVTIGRKKTDDGEPLVEFSRGGVIGTLSDLKEFIARYEDAYLCPHCAKWK